MANQLFFACLMLATGIGIPVMAALSATLGTKYESPAFAASVLFSGGAVYFGCFPFRCRGWSEAIPENIVAVLFLLRRCVRSLLRP